MGYLMPKQLLKKNSCDTMKGVRQADDLFVCFGTKPNKGLSTRSRRDWKWKRERQSEELEEGTQRRQLAKGDAEEQLTLDSRRDQSAWDRVQEQWGKTSQDVSAFLMALWKFCEGCTSALVYRCTGNAVSRNHPSCTWVNPSPYCSFVHLFFFSRSLGCISCAVKKCVIPLLEPLNESLAKTDCFKKLISTGGRGGIVTQQWYYLTHSWGDKGVHTFPKDISPKVNTIAQLEFELIYFTAAVQHLSYYATGTSLWLILFWLKLKSHRSAL